MPVYTCVHVHVHVTLQVNNEDTDRPVTLVLVCSAPLPCPEVLAQVVLPHDPPQAGVDLAVDLHADLAFPTNSFLGAGAFGQVRPGPRLTGCLSCLGA